MKVGYIRTSKKDQKPEIQRRGFLAFGCEKIFEEQIVPEGRPTRVVGGNGVLPVG